MCSSDLEIPDMLVAADCLLITSRREGSPCMLQEALACHTPVVSVDVGDAPERLAGVKNTIIAAPRAESLAAALVQLIRRPLRCFANVDHLSFDYLAKRLETLYEEICEHPTSLC